MKTVRLRCYFDAADDFWLERTCVGIDTQDGRTQYSGEFIERKTYLLPADFDPLGKTHVDVIHANNEALRARAMEVTYDV